MLKSMAQQRRDFLDQQSDVFLYMIFCSKLLKAVCKKVLKATKTLMNSFLPFPGRNNAS